MILTKRSCNCSSETTFLSLSKIKPPPLQKLKIRQQ
ncbi:hypothetical protein T4D_114 [Trichinella pseudospiralis]|uniref:Uncharacterized protein n=1 Tax=Trichinella pseudospiralis TaxID=6337 RepID=A0A0V1DLU9_TRIPS|nr:hypothetical protein T4D_114 [Trichinella pseudospiralis]